MQPARLIRRLPIVLSLAVGTCVPLTLSGCGSGETAKTETGPVPNSPVATAKDSMEYFKKSKSAPANRPSRPR